MNKLKRAYYAFMYELTDNIMWLAVDDREHWGRWWDISEAYREKRDLVG